MQEVLNRLLASEKEGEQIVSEARSRAAALKTEADNRSSARLKAEREKLRLRMETELAATTAAEEENFHRELASLERKKLQLTTDGAKNKTAVLEKLKGILCETEIK
jgi:hypothetical protein